MENIMLSDRLRAVAEMVSPCGTVADIGCDHCLTLMYLLQTGACISGIGSDINRGPIEKARESISQLGYGAYIELRQGAGLEKIAPGEADAIVISGMGGLTVNGILSEGLRVAKTASQLILQPQSHIPDVRMCLHELGFRILDEKTVYELGKYYFIIKAESGFEKYQSETDYLYGKVLLRKKDAVLKRFLHETLNENAKISEKLNMNLSEKSVLRLAEIENVNNIIEGVLSCL